MVDPADVLQDEFALINDEMSAGHTYVGRNQFHGLHRNFTDLNLSYNPKADAVGNADYAELQVFKTLRRIELSISLDESAYGEFGSTGISSISAI